MTSPMLRSVARRFPVATLLLVPMACTPDRELPGVPPPPLEFRLSSASPRAGTAGVGLDEPLRLALSGPVLPSTVGGAFEVSGPAGPIAGTTYVEVVTAGETGLLFVPATAWPASSTIRVLVGRRLRDAWDRPVRNVAEWSFVTGAASGTVPSSPSLVASVPPDGATNVSTRARPVLVFSHLLSGASLAAHVTVSSGSGPLACDVVLGTDGRTVTVAPAVPLPVDAQVVVRVSAGLASADGRPSGVGLRVAFRTTDDPTAGAPPEALALRPVDGAVEVPRGALLEARFARPIDPASVTDESVVVQTGASARLGVQRELSEGNRTLRLVPVEPLPLSTLVRVGLEGLRTDEGVVGEPIRWSFTVSADPFRGVRPTVSATMPAQGAQDADPRAQVTITFSKPVLRETIGESSVVASVDGNPMPLALAPSVDGTRLDVGFGQLPDDVPVEVELREAIEDAEGLSLEPFTLSFRTQRDASPPTIVRTEPVEGATGVAVNAVVRLVAGEPFVAGMVEVAARAGDVDWTVAVTERPSEGVVDVAFVDELPASTPVSLTLSGLRDARGNEAPPFVLAFTTGAAPDRDPPVFAGLARVHPLDERRIRIEWDAAADASPVTYIVFKSVPPAVVDFQSSPVRVVSGLATTIDGLAPAVTYAFAVRARDGAGNVDANTQVRQATTLDLTPPLFSSAPSVSALAGTESLEVTWSAATDVVTPARDLRYRLYVARASGGQDFTAAGRALETGPGAVRAVLTGAPDESGAVVPLVGGVRYHVVVRAVDAAGNESSNSQEGSAVVVDVRPPVFGGAVTAVVQGRGSALVSWTAATDNVTPGPALRYRVFVASPPAEYPEQPVVEVVGVDSAVLTGLVTDVPLRVRVVAVDGAGLATANAQEPEFMLDGAPPAFPNDDPFATGGATSPGSNRLEVGWVAASDAVTPASAIEYLVFRATTAGAVFTAVPQVVTGTTTVSIGSVPAGAWFVGVRARDAAGNVDSNTRVSGPVTVADPVPTWSEVRAALSSCMGCHPGAEQWEAMDRDELVDPSSDGTASCGGRRLVVPGDPSASLLYTKTQPNPACGGRMSASAAQQSILRRWIEGGAPE